MITFRSRIAAGVLAVSMLSVASPAFAGPSMLAIPDTATVEVGATVAVNVLDNDSLLAAPASLEVVVAPAHGSAVVDTTKADWPIVYTPTVGYSGVDTFTYRVTDPDGTTSDGLVTVTVDGPVAAAPYDGTVVALSAATGAASTSGVLAQGGQLTPANSAVVRAGQTTTITNVAWGDGCTSAGASFYNFLCDQALVGGDAVVVSTLEASATAVVTGVGAVAYTPAAGSAADTITIRSADGTRTTTVKVSVGTDDGAGLDLPASVDLEGGPTQSAEAWAYRAVWLIPTTGIAYVTVDGFTGDAGLIRLDSSRVSVSGGDLVTGAFTGGTATVTLWTADGDHATVTLNAPPAEGMTAPPVALTYLDVHVAPGRSTSIDLAANGVQAVEVLDASGGVHATAVGTVMTVTADVVPLLTQSSGSIGYRVQVGDTWSDRATVTVWVVPDITVHPTIQEVMTWAGAPVTWILSTGMPAEFSGPGIVSAVPGDFTLDTIGELQGIAGVTAGSITQDGSFATFTPALGFTSAYHGDVTVGITFSITVTRTDGVIYTAPGASTYARIVVQGPIAQGETLALKVGEQGQVDLGAGSLWGTTSDLTSYGDTLVSDGSWGGASSTDPVWEDFETSWTATGSWITPEVMLAPHKAFSGTTLIVSTTGQADLAGSDPVSTAALDPAQFAGDLVSDGTVATALATEVQVTAVGFSLVTASGLRGLPATLWLAATEDMTPPPVDPPVVDPPAVTSPPGPTPIVTAPAPVPAPAVPEAPRRTVMVTG